MKELAPNVYVQTEWPGSNTLLVVTKEGVVVVDTPHRPSDAIAWRDEVASRGKLRYLISTEPHYDHITGAPFFSGIYVAHEETRRGILNATVEGVRERVQQMYPDDMALIENYQMRIPTVTFSEQLNLYLGDHAFHLINLPGHTVGQTVVYIPEARVVCTGDNVYNRCLPFMTGCVPIQWLESLKKIEEMDVDVIVPGHGEICDRSYIPEFYSFIQEWVDTVRRAVEQGLSREEAVDKISFIGRYPIVDGWEWKYPENERLAVERLYNLLAS